MVGNEEGNEGWFMSLEVGVCDNNSSDLDTNTILLNCLGFNEDEELILDVLTGNLQPYVQKRVSHDPI